MSSKMKSWWIRWQNQQKSQPNWVLPAITEDDNLEKRPPARSHGSNTKEIRSSRTIDQGLMETLEEAQIQAGRETRRGKQPDQNLFIVCD